MSLLSVPTAGFVGSVALLLLSARLLPAAAAEPPSRGFGFQADDQEASAMASYQSARLDPEDGRPFATSLFTLLANYAYFPSSALQGGATLSWANLSTDLSGADISVDWIGLGAFGNYYPASGSQLAPFCGAHVTHYWLVSDLGQPQDFAATSFAAGAQLGLKYFIFIRGTVFLEARYDHNVLASGDAEQTQMTTLLVFLGLSYIF